MIELIPWFKQILREAAKDAYRHRVFNVKVVLLGDTEKRNG